MITFHTLSNDVVVHQHTAEENAVNAYLIGTPEEVVAIDATFLLSDARDLRATLDEIGKPLAGVFITHPHPDHEMGLVSYVAVARPQYSQQRVSIRRFERSNHGKIGRAHV